jgi:hypothetical protein
MAGSQPKTVKPGQPMSAKLFNQQNKSLQTATGVAPGLTKRQVGKSVAISQTEDTKAPQFGSVFKKAQITAIKEDYLECVFYNERTEAATASTVNVAKNRKFRPSLYDAVTITYPNGDVIEYTKDATNPEWKRQADNQTTTVDQIVVPSWYVGETINIFNAASSAVTDVDSYPINWEESEPRVWAVI